MKRNYGLLRAISTGMFCIHPRAIDAYMPRVISLINGDLADDFAQERNDMSSSAVAFLNQYKSFRSEASPFVSSENETWNYDNFPVKIGGIVVIPVLDAITQEDSCISAGTKTIMSWYQKAENDPEVKGIIEVVNSPGGEVFGTRVLANFKANITKPVVGYCEGMQCSAAQYIAAPNAYQFAASEECLIGSIGVMTSYKSMAKFYAKNGIEIKEVYSKGSPKKNDAYRRAEKGDFKGLEDELLFELDESFMGFMQMHRPNITQAALEGQEFTTKKAIENGLIDEIGSFQDAYNKVIDLSNKEFYLQSNNNQIKEMKKVNMLVPSALVGAFSLLGATEVALEEEDEVVANDETIEEDEAVATDETVENPEASELQAQMQAISDQNKQLLARLSALEKAKPSAAARSIARAAQTDEQPIAETSTEEEIITAFNLQRGNVKAIEQRIK